MTDSLEAHFEHLLFRSDSISPDSLDAFSIKDGDNIIRVFVLKTNISLLGFQNARKEDLAVSSSEEERGLFDSLD